MRMNCFCSFFIVILLLNLIFSIVCSNDTLNVPTGQATQGNYYHKEIGKRGHIPLNLIDGNPYGNFEQNNLNTENANFQQNNHKNYANTPNLFQENLVVNQQQVIPPISKIYMDDYIHSLRNEAIKYDYKERDKIEHMKKVGILADANMANKATDISGNKLNWKIADEELPYQYKGNQIEFKGNQKSVPKYVQNGKFIPENYNAFIDAQFGTGNIYDGRARSAECHGNTCKMHQNVVGEMNQVFDFAKEQELSRIRNATLGALPFRGNSIIDGSSNQKPTELIAQNNNDDNKQTDIYKSAAEMPAQKVYDEHLQTQQQYKMDEGNVFNNQQQQQQKQQVNYQKNTIDSTTHYSSPPAIGLAQQKDVHYSSDVINNGLNQQQKGNPNHMVQEWLVNNKHYFEQQQKQQYEETVIPPSNQHYYQQDPNASQNLNSSQFEEGSPPAPNNQQQKTGIFGKNQQIPFAKQHSIADNLNQTAATNRHNSPQKDWIRNIPPQQQQPTMIQWRQATIEPAVHFPQQQQQKQQANNKNFHYNFIEQQYMPNNPQQQWNYSNNKKNIANFIPENNSNNNRIQQTAGIALYKNFDQSNGHKQNRTSPQNSSNVKKEYVQPLNVSKQQNNEYQQKISLNSDKLKNTMMPNEMLKPDNVAEKIAAFENLAKLYKYGALPQNFVAQKIAYFDSLAETNSPNGKTSIIPNHNKAIEVFKTLFDRREELKNDILAKKSKPNLNLTEAGRKRMAAKGSKPRIGDELY